MSVSCDDSVNSFILEKRDKENWGLRRLLIWLRSWDNFKMLDEIICLAHILNVLDKANLAVSRNEVRNCFNHFYNKEFYGDKKSYLNWLYEAFHVRKRAIVSSGRSYRVISGRPYGNNLPVLETNNENHTKPL